MLDPVYLKLPRCQTIYLFMDVLEALDGCYQSSQTLKRLTNRSHIHAVPSHD
jgi:hypothetical protein